MTDTLYAAELRAELDAIGSTVTSETRGQMLAIQQKYSEREAATLAKAAEMGLPPDLAKAMLAEAAATGIGPGFAFAVQKLNLEKKYRMLATERAAQAELERAAQAYGITRPELERTVTDAAAQRQAHLEELHRQYQAEMAQFAGSGNLVAAARIRGKYRNLGLNI